MFRYTAYIYFDKNCDGKDGAGTNGHPQWQVTLNAPFESRDEDVDNDGKCAIDHRENTNGFGLVSTFDVVPPSGQYFRSCSTFTSVSEYYTMDFTVKVVGCPDYLPDYSYAWGAWTLSDGGGSSSDILLKCGWWDVRVEVESCSVPGYQNCPCINKRGELRKEIRQQPACTTASTTSTTTTTTTTTKVSTTTTITTSTTSTTTTTATTATTISTAAIIPTSLPPLKKSDSSVVDGENSAGLNINNGGKVFAESGGRPLPQGLGSDLNATSSSLAAASLSNGSLAVVIMSVLVVVVGGVAIIIYRRQQRQAAGPAQGAAGNNNYLNPGFRGDGGGGQGPVYGEVAGGGGGDSGVTAIYKTINLRARTQVEYAEPVKASSQDYAEPMAKTPKYHLHEIKQGEVEYAIPMAIERQPVGADGYVVDNFVNGGAENNGEYAVVADDDNHGDGSLGGGEAGGGVSASGGSGPDGSSADGNGDGAMNSIEISSSV